jgi:hypothetical protein
MWGTPSRSRFGKSVAGAIPTEASYSSLSSPLYRLLFVVVRLLLLCNLLGLLGWSLGRLFVDG